MSEAIKNNNKTKLFDSHSKYKRVERFFAKHLITLTIGFWLRYLS